MIKRLQTPEELSELFSQIPSKWIQWLTERCTNPKIYIIADPEGFIIAIDSVLHPVSDYFTIILYDGDIKEQVIFLRALAKQKGAEQIIISANEITPELESLGFEQVSINMRIKV